MNWNWPKLPRHHHTNHATPASRPSAFRPALERLEDRLAPANLPSGFSEALFGGGLVRPIAMEFAPDGRLFVSEQGGQLRVVRAGTLLPTPFVTLNVDSQGERGLLGVALDPNFQSNGYVYVYYTVASGPWNRLSRFTASGDVAVPGSETVLFEFDELADGFMHNGGAIHFGSDGKLYVAIGDDSRPELAQQTDTLLGKMLRLNADGSIPPDNPFYDTLAGPYRAIWALGLRNPFTFAVQPGTGRIFINDVGAASWEEINDGAAGSNYGWPVYEGPSTDPGYTSPLYAYPHGGWPDGDCAITGGTFYNPPVGQFPGDYIGTYFFADFCSGWIRRLNPSSGSVTDFATGLLAPVDLKVGPDGSLYYLVRGTRDYKTEQPTGAVYKIDYPGSPVAPVITQHPANRTVAVGQPATFTVSATGSNPLSYQWQRNGVSIPGATAPTYTLPSATPADSGAQFRAIVSNAAGSAISNPAVLTVTANQPPTATITAPAAGTLYNGGMTISFAGTASDPEDGGLPASAFTWQVDFHHADHTHPFLPPTSGLTSGFFQVPTRGETDANVWYRIYLTVRDSAGLTATTYRDIQPRTATLTLLTSPAGLQVVWDGQPRTTPYAVVGVAGILRTLGVMAPQTVGGTTYTFDRWSDGGAASREIAFPASNTIYTAFYRSVNLPPTTTSLYSLLNPSTPGQPVTFMALVSSGGGLPTGTITFRAGATVLGTAPLTGSIAFFATAALSGGSHPITATYNGDATFAPSTSAVVTQTVLVTQAATTTALTSSANPAAVGQVVTLTATVSVVPPGSGLPTGTVTFRAGTTVLGTAPLSAAGQATVTTAALGVGSHSLTAVYSGDTAFTPSTSAALTQVVNPAATTTTLTSSANPATAGQALTLTARVTPMAPGAGTPAGTMTFRDGAAVLGSATLVNGVATFTTSALAVGNHSLTATYGGDANFSGSTSTALSQAVEAATRAATTTALHATSSTSAAGQPVTFIAIVSPVQPRGTSPTGTVTFRDGPVVLGTVPVLGTVALFTTASLGVGDHSITAVYNGDSVFAESISVVLSHRVL
jgi:glucose/arabinose dehydrogenase